MINLVMKRATMRLTFIFSLIALASLAVSCRNSNEENPVVSQRYVHKYGYAVSKDEWDENHYPGQVITKMRDGVTVTATYEVGMLHGPCTYSFPHSQTIATYELYNQGHKVKEITYDTKGMPIQEHVQLSPTRYAITLWQTDGTPLSIEEYAGQELLEGQYFTANNEIESRVEKGHGLRIQRNSSGLLLAKDLIEAGYVVKHETFYPNGAPESICFFSQNILNGEKKTFTSSGEPLNSEEWVNGKLHGKVTYYENGVKARELSYLFGQKNGSETHFLDGVNVSAEIQWENDKKHGPTTFYVDGSPAIEYWYDGRLVTRDAYEYLYKRDEMISNISQDVKMQNSR